MDGVPKLIRQLTRSRARSPVKPHVCNRYPVRISSCRTRALAVYRPMPGVDPLRSLTTGSLVVGKQVEEYCRHPRPIRPFYISLATQTNTLQKLS